MNHTPAPDVIRKVFPFLFLFTFAFSSSSVLAETATQSTSWAERYEKAEWVSRVRIESVASLINPAMSRTSLVAVQGYRYTASVLRDWKAEQGSDVRFQVDLSDCHLTLAIDGEYVVFGYRNHRGRLQSYSCDDVVSVKNAEDLLSFLDKRSRSPQLVGQADS